MPAVTIIVALYNAEMYLSRFLQSLENQTFKDFEAIFVDDASTDNSVNIVTEKNDSRFKILRNEVNQGAGVARNAGIRAASGKTLCFADPDDILPEKSLEVRYDAYKKYNAIVRACHEEFDANGVVINREIRPQALSEICIPSQCAATVGINLFLSAHWAWLFPTKLIQRNEIFNKEGTKTAEDIQFLVRAFFRLTRVVWIPDIVYHWVKRDQSLSTKVYSGEHYCDYLDCIAGFYEEARQHGSVHLADSFCDVYLATYLNHLAMQLYAGKSTDSEALSVFVHAASICEVHGVFDRCIHGLKKEERLWAGILLLWNVLKSTEKSSLNRLINGSEQVEQKQKELSFKQIHQAGWQKEIFFDAFDAEKRLLKARYLFSGVPVTEQIVCEGKTLTASYAKNRLVHEGEGFSIFERILWLPVPEASTGRYTLTLDEQEVALDLPVATIPQLFAVEAIQDDSAFPQEIKSLRRLARSKTVQSRYKDAWMFIDRDTQADDNAEHLYRWVIKHHPGINAFFVLRQDSPDWSRLAAEGFRLIPFGSMEHKLLFILAKNLISSQMDAYIVNYIDKKFVGDLRNCEFTGLQHGVTVNDISPWLNTIPINCFITATKDEYQSIVADGTAYTLTRKEVVRSGFPRHDSLLLAGEPEKNILVMPTWRANLAGGWDGQRGTYNPQFAASLFARAWTQFLISPELAVLCRQYGYTVAFRPHRCFIEYLQDFNLPDCIETPTEEPIQSLLKRSRLLITDFSSIAFDMAFMHRPVLYYHFESREQFTKSQNHLIGYFSPEQDGFGPVCTTERELMEHLALTLANNGQLFPVYRERVAKTFDLRDGKCCARVATAIRNLHQPGNMEVSCG